MLEDARYKPGSGGQLIAFVPSLDLVVTRQTGGSGSWEYEEYLRRACAAVMKKTKGRRQRTEDRGQKTEDRRRRKSDFRLLISDF